VTGPCVLTVISCGEQKQALDEGETVPARELYTSSVHTCKDRYGRHSHGYYIASAKFGLVHHEELLPMYDRRLSELSDAARIQWAHDVLGDIAETAAVIDADAVVFLGGREYVDPLNVRANLLDIPLFTPWQTLDQITGVGKGMAWCNDESHWPVNLDTLEPAILGEARNDGAQTHLAGWSE